MNFFNEKRAKLRVSIHFHGIS